MSPDSPNGEIVQDVSLMPETASDIAVRFIRAMIFSGELGPGDRLPPERDLGARLGISRMTLRLALKALESTGYIVTTRGSHGGSRVAGADSLVECWKQWMRQHARELDDVFEFRTTVETRLAALAAERAGEADIAAMERALEREGEPQEWPSLFRADMDIHRMIARAAMSPHLESAMIEARGDLFLPVDLHQLETGDSEVHGSHGSIIAAIKAKDPVAACEAMKKHMQIIRELTDKALAASGLTPTEN